MKWSDFLKKVGSLPLIETEHLLVGVYEPGAIEVQISRWVKAGKLIQLKRGAYLLSEPYRKTMVSEYYIASALKKPSYLSLEKALEYHGMIPESVRVFTSVTTKRPSCFNSEAGTFDYRHIKRSLFWGYDSVKLDRQTVFIASPEKALLDFLYFKKVKVSSDYIEELRLQNLENFNFGRFMQYARRFKRHNILRQAEMVRKYAVSVKEGEKTL